MLTLCLLLVTLQGYKKGYATVPKPADLEAHLRSTMYTP